MLFIDAPLAETLTLSLSALMLTTHVARAQLDESGSASIYVSAVAGPDMYTITNAFDTASGLLYWPADSRQFSANRSLSAAVSTASTMSSASQGAALILGPVTGGITPMAQLSASGSAGGAGQVTWLPGPGYNIYGYSRPFSQSYLQFGLSAS